MPIDIVIVNWNSGDQLKDALKSIVLFNKSYIKKVIIVDNFSSDFSLKFLEDFKSDDFLIEVVRNCRNEGFGFACNQGASLGDSEYILFLNPDAMIYENSLKPPVDYLDAKKNSDVAVVGVQLVNESGEIARSCARFPSLLMFFIMALGLNRLSFLKSYNHHMTDWDHETSCEVDHVIGAFYLIRRNAFEALGGFDERFFVYLEDLDLSLRVKKLGRKIVYLSNAQAFHEGGGVSKKVKATRLFYALRSRLLYGIKHYSSVAVWGLVGVTLLIEPLTRIIFALLSGGVEDVRNTLNGYKMLWKALPSIVKGKGR